MQQSDDTYILVAENLTKSYEGKVALRGLSFSLQAGRILGFLGPNGAGKTTSIRILTTIFEPSSGQFYVDGISSDNPELIRRKIGVLPESLGFYKQMTGIEFLTYFGQHYERKFSTAKENAIALLKEVGLAEIRHRARPGQRSRGSFSRRADSGARPARQNGTDDAGQTDCQREARRGDLLQPSLDGGRGALRRCGDSAGGSGGRDWNGAGCGRARQPQYDSHSLPEREHGSCRSNSD